jgi:hypothetical protein
MLHRKDVRPGISDNGLKFRCTEMQRTTYENVIGAACLRNGDLKIERDPLLRRIGVAVIGADDLRRQMI